MLLSPEWPFSLLGVSKFLGLGSQHGFCQTPQGKLIPSVEPQHFVLVVPLQKSFNVILDIASDLEGQQKVFKIQKIDRKNDTLILPVVANKIP